VCACVCICLQDETVVHRDTTIPVRRSQQPSIPAGTCRQHRPLYAHTSRHRQTSAGILTTHLTHVRRVLTDVTDLLNDITDLLCCISAASEVERPIHSRGVTLANRTSRFWGDGTQWRARPKTLKAGLGFCGVAVHFSSYVCSHGSWSITQWVRRVVDHWPTVCMSVYTVDRSRSASAGQGQGQFWSSIFMVAILETGNNSFNFRHVLKPADQPKTANDFVHGMQSLVLGCP